MEASDLGLRAAQYGPHLGSYALHPLACTVAEADSQYGGHPRDWYRTTECSTTRPASSVSGEPEGAMRWKKADRVIGRIVERVIDRAAKGDAFRRT
jgi:hypothetical protein